LTYPGGFQVCNRTSVCGDHGRRSLVDAVSTSTGTFPVDEASTYADHPPDLNIPALRPAPGARPPKRRSSRVGWLNG
jgi:hypothetical protein